MTLFNPANLFNINALSSVEAAADIPVTHTLTDYAQNIQNIFGLPTIPNFDLKCLLEYWLKDAGVISLSWKNLLLIIRLLNLDELAHRMETYLNGATEKLARFRENAVVLTPVKTAEYPHVVFTIELPSEGSLMPRLSFSSPSRAWARG